VKPRIAVVGAGHLGNYHLQKVGKDADAELVAVVELDPKKREKLARDYGIAGESELAALRGRVDGVIIAAPTTAHHALGLMALELGLHVLIEKPIATTVAQAEELTARARERGLVLQVGHTERWNPAIAAALAMVDKPAYLVAERLAPFTGRSTDVDVILDLMIHDLDITASLVPADLVEVRAVGVPVITTQVDMCAARLQFADGTVAQLSAGRASMEPVRKIRLFTPERYVSIDCAAREVKSVRRLPPEPGSTWPQLTGEPVEVPEGDALQHQDHDFVRCIIEGRAPRVDGAAGTRALALAEAVKAAMTVPLGPG
jgi:predicted dehydrogenase